MSARATGATGASSAVVRVARSAWGGAAAGWREVDAGARRRALWLAGAAWAERAVRAGRTGGAR